MMRALSISYDETIAYTILFAGFLLLVILLRTDVGASLFDQDSLFYELPDSALTPKLELELDFAGDNYAVRIHTENFLFAHMCTNPETDEVLVGHAHVYLDGRKIDSVYEPLALLPKLAAGKYRLTVSLNLLPDHKAILVNGVPVSTEIELVIPESNNRGPYSDERIPTL